MNRPVTKQTLGTVRFLFEALIVAIVFIATPTLVILTIIELRQYLPEPETEEIQTEPLGPEIEQYNLEDPKDIERMIVSYAGFYGVEAEDALRIAHCESTLKYDAKNPRSSATGLYQWIDGSWDAIGAPGDRLNPHDNIRAFMKHYPKNPQW